MDVHRIDHLFDEEIAQQAAVGAESELQRAAHGVVVAVALAASFGRFRLAREGGRGIFSHLIDLPC